MKNLNLKIIGTVFCSLIATFSFSQGNNWRINGNNNTNPTNNFLGTTNNFGLSIRTNNTPRFYIDNGGTGNNAGRIGIGNNLPNGFTPQARLHLHQTGGVNTLRFTNNATGATGNDGLVMGISPTGDAFFINNELNQNFSWYNQGGGAPGTLLGRMRLYDGGIGQNTGRLAISNDLPAAFVPVDRLTMYENSNTAMNATRYQNTGTGTTATDGAQFGIDNATNTLYTRQFEQRPIIWESPDNDPGGIVNMNEWMRIENTGNMNTQGFVGLNNNAPIFHLDILTEERPGGELLYRSRIEGDLAAYYGVINLAGVANTSFIPGVIGKQSNLSGGSALTTIGSIDPAQDLGANLTAATRFISARLYDPSVGAFTLQRINVINDRRIFQWMNGVDVLMTMDATGYLGIGQENPGNRVEINSDFYNGAGTLYAPGTNPTATTANGQIGANGAATGFSGLRFTDLNLSSVPQTNPGTGVLSVDANGDVILVDGALGNGVGDYCANAPVAPMIDDFIIPMLDKTYNFQSDVGGRINIGSVFCGVNGDARVYIRNNNVLSTGIRSESIQTGGIGGWFDGLKYGIYAQGTISAGTPPNTAAIYANGDVVITGTPFLANPAVPISDQMFKTNVSNLTSTLGIIDQLNPVTYHYTTNTYDNRVHFNNQLQYGFIAQEVEQILPELVTQGHLAEVKDSMGNVIATELDYKGLNYNGLFAILTKGIQEQQAIITSQDSVINDLNTRLSSLENCLSNILPFLCQINSTAIQQNDEETQESIVKELQIELANVQSIVLGQNVPNPFAEQTVIEYTLPMAVQKAQILFYDLKGQLINTVDIQEMGEGRLTVFANDLSSGTYTYTLVADGQVIATKRMVKAD